jgi:hypothetical protein
MKLEKEDRSLSDEEAKKWVKRVGKCMNRLLDDAFAGIKSIPEEERRKLTKTLPKMEALKRIKDPEIYTGDQSVEEAEKALAAHFHTLYETGFSLDEGRKEWFAAIGKMTTHLGLGTVPRWKRQQYMAARIIYDFLLRNERPSINSIQAELGKYDSREVTQDQVSEMVESEGLSKLMFQEKRGRK